MTHKRESRTASVFSTRLLFQALLGAAAGLVAAGLDARQASYGLGGASNVVWLFGRTAGTLGVYGALLGASAGLLDGLGRKLGRRAHLKEELGASALLTLVSAPGLFFVAFRLFQGGFMSKLPGRTALIAATGIVLAALFFAGARICIALIDRADRGALRRWHIALFAIGLAALGLGFRWCDAHLYKRLYLYLHAALGLATLGSFTLAFRLAFGQRIARMSFRPAAIFTAAVLSLFVAGRIVGAGQSVKAAEWRRTATLAGLLHSIYSFDKTPETVHSSQKVSELRRKRSLRAKAAAAGDWPRFPGAHFLFITVDALRADRLGIYGHTGRDLSPNIDAWARKNGVVFERAYCTAPHSSFSITSLHTSRFTHEEALLGRDISHPTLAEILEDYGYRSTAFYTQGIFFTEGDKVGHYRRTKFGFDDVTNGAFEPAELTDKAIEAIEAAQEDGPTFTWVHYFNVHEPYRSKRFGTAPKDRYDGEILETDPEVVRLIESASKALSGNLIVVFGADHGEEFNDHGGQYHGSTLYEEQVRVPLIISVPSAEPRFVKAPVSMAAIAPTALKLLGIEPPASMLGQDLRPAVFGGDEKHVAEPVFASVMRHHMAIRWPWKLIAEPSLKLYELYNLESDPLERANLYDRRPALADELLQEIRAWLDGLAEAEDEAKTALNMGKMRDTRAVPELKRMALNTGAVEPDRLEAVQLLGKMGDKSVIDALKSLLSDKSEKVAVAAALSLSALGDSSGQDLMRDALFDPDPKIRDRAALALGRMGDDSAAQALVEALGRDDVEIREQAIRALGRLGDPDTVQPLLDAMAEERTRYLVVLALGMLGDARAFEPLMDVLDRDRHADVRGYAVVALGWLELKGAVPRLLRLLRDEPDIKWTSEALVRLGAVGEAPLFGSDAAAGLQALKSGIGRCTAKAKKIQSEFLGRTTCRTTGPIVGLEFFADASKGATVIVSARHLLRDKSAAVPLSVRVDGVEVGQVELFGELMEQRLETPAQVWRPGQHRVELRLKKNSAFEIDHLLVLANDK